MHFVTFRRGASGPSFMGALLSRQRAARNREQLLRTILTPWEHCAQETKSPDDQRFENLSPKGIRNFSEDHNFLRTLCWVVLPPRGNPQPAKKRVFLTEFFWEDMEDSDFQDLLQKQFFPSWIPELQEGIQKGWNSYVLCHSTLFHFPPSSGSLQVKGKNLAKFGMKWGCMDKVQ